jgi:hypothetical protein
MLEARLTRSPLPRAWTLATAAAMGLASVGCTMCPDPFDYSGPVPNGSSPQNDFRARSNGILPLGAAPRPWPLIVENGGAPAEGPPDNEPTPTLADEADADGLQQTVAVVGEFNEEIVIDGEPEVVLETAGSTPDALEPVPVAAEQTDTPPFQTSETPGWRARRR